MLRYLAQPRWIPWHLFCVAALAGCLWMAGWQWSVATAPAPAGVEVSVWRNYAYAVNWLIFAVVGVWFWWRLPRDQMRAEAASQGSRTEAEDPAQVPVAEEAAAQRAAEARQGESEQVAGLSRGVTPIASAPSDEVGSAGAGVDSDDDAGARGVPVTRQQRFDPFAGA